MRYLLALFLSLALSFPALAREGEVTITARPDRSSVLPGDQLVIAVVLDHAEGWHCQADEAAIKAAKSPLAQRPTTIATGAPKGILVGPVQWPKAAMVSGSALGDPMASVPVFEGRAIAYVPIVVEANKSPGPVDITITVNYQACDDRVCLMPIDEVLSVPLTVRAAGEAAATTTPPNADDFAAFDRSVFSKMLSGQVPATQPLQFNLFGKSFTISTDGAGFIILLLLALLGGILLNFTPCVLPVIPIKIMSLQHSAENPAKRVMLGIVMFVGVIAFWMGLGLAIAFVAGFTAINQLFQYPAFSIGIGVFILAMAIGMLGLFSINLPQWVYSIDPKRESVAGSFLFGVMTAVLSTPCTAPFMGTAAAWASKQPPLYTLATFAAIGIGMGLPYLILALNPKLVAKVPRTGPASELIKQVMGIFMLAVAVFFICTCFDPLARLPVDPAVRWFWWIVGGLIVIAGLWLIHRTWAITKQGTLRAIWSAVAFALIFAGAWVGFNLSSHGPIKWVGYTPDRLAKATAEGKVVIMDFTAEWCFNCKALENAVLHRADIVPIFKDPDVVALKVDFTGTNAPGQAKLKELNWVGIPLLAIYGPGLKEPLKYDSYTAQTVLDAVAKARGKPAAR